MAKASSSPRTFKTKEFAKDAVKAGISDADLCRAIVEVRLGQAVKLGGGVYKKRLNKNLYRSIIVNGNSTYWIYTALFAKSKKSNIAADELKAFLKVSKALSKMVVGDIDKLKKSKKLVEICNAEIQE